MELLNKIQQKLNCPKSQRNDFGGFNYRSCEDIVEAVKPLLGTATLTMSDEIVSFSGEMASSYEVTPEDGNATRTVDGVRFYIKATVTLTDGDESISATGFAREPLQRKGMDASQLSGCASSYARKYALNGLFCIDDVKDADTNEYQKG